MIKGDITVGMDVITNGTKRTVVRVEPKWVYLQSDAGWTYRVQKEGFRKMFSEVENG